MIESTRVAAYAVLVQNNRMLLCRISSELPDSAGKWTMPGGGLDFGESPEDAVVREVREESGLDISVTGIADVCADILEYPDRRLHLVRVLYHAEVVGGDLCCEVDGSTDVAEWFSREEAEALDAVEVGRRGMELAFPSGSL